MSESARVPSPGRSRARWRRLVSVVTLASIGAGQLLLLAAAPASAAVRTTRVSVSSNGEEVPGDSYRASISETGRFVVFDSTAALVPADTNSFRDVYVYDRDFSSVSLVSVGLEGGAGNHHSWLADIDVTGRFVTFVSLASDLVPDDTNGEAEVENSGRDVFLRDLEEGGSTVRVSVSDTGAQLTAGINIADDQRPRVSARGSRVVFVAANAELPGGSSDRNVYVRDLANPDGATTLLASQTDTGSPLTGGSTNEADISDDGRFVVFASSAATTTGTDNQITVRDGILDVYRREIDSAVSGVHRLNWAPDGTDANGHSQTPRINHNGSVVAFNSTATNLDPNPDMPEGGGTFDIFVVEPDGFGPNEPRTTRLTASTEHQALVGDISVGGDWVAFSTTDALAADDTNGLRDAYIIDRWEHTIERLSVGNDGTQLANGGSRPALAGDGTIGAFESSDSTIDRSDTGTDSDVFAVDLAATDPTDPTVSASLSVSQGSIFPTSGEALPVNAGSREFAVADIPYDRLTAIVSPPDGSQLESLPWNKMPWNKMPWNKMPWNKMPWNKMPWNKMPWNKMPYSNLTLNKIPVTSGWESVLEGSALTGVPLHLVTFADVLADPVASVKLQQLTLGDVDLASVFADVGLQSMALAGTTLNELPFDLIGPRTGGSDWCALLGTMGYPCSAGYDPATTSLLELDMQGAPLHELALHELPVNRLPWAASLVGQVSLADLAATGRPLGKVPLGQLDVANSPFGTVLLSDLDAGTRDAVVDCSDPAVFDCTVSGRTLGDAASVGAIRATATLDRLSPVFGTLELREITGHLSTGVTFGIVILSLLDLAEYAWEAMDLGVLGPQEFSPHGEPLTYRLSIEPAGGPSSAPTTATVTLPDEFRYVAGSAYLTARTLCIDVPDGCSASTSSVEPVVSTTDPVTLSFDLGDRPADGFYTYTITFDARPGLTIGTFGAHASVEVGAARDTVENGAPVAVRENWEEAADRDPATAPVLQPGTVTIGHVHETDDLDYYRIPVPPVGTRVSVRLSNLASDTDLVMYRPVAETAPSTASPRDIPLGSTPIDDAGALGPQAPEILGDIPIGAIGVGASDVSAHRGTTPEEAEAFSTIAATDSSGQRYYTIQVSGYNGETSAEPYSATVNFDTPITPPSCTTTFPHDQGSPAASLLRSSAGVATALNGLPTGTDTLFLVNEMRLRGMFGESDRKAVVDALEKFIADAAGLAVPVNAAVLSVDAHEPVRTAAAGWDADACTPEKANAYVAEVGALVRAAVQLVPTISNVVIVGADDLIPMGRVFDGTADANEDEYADSVKGDNPLDWALRTKHILTDDPYGDLNPIPWLDRFLYLPDLSLGRLVETPGQITGQLGQFIAAKGEVDPTTAMTAGYDFIADGAEAVDQALAPRVADRDTLISETWTRNDLIGGMFPGTDASPDVLSPNAHYDHYRSLPAAGNTANDHSDAFTVDDIPAPPTSGPPALAGRIVFTMGCHAGLSVPSSYVDPTGNVEARDWAETYGGQQAIYIANTGFGFGDTETVALSETLFADLAKGLASPTGGSSPTTVGGSLRYAKQSYFGQLGVYGAYDEKVLQQAVLYGLPMYRVPAATTAASQTAVTDVTTSPSSITGLREADQSFDLTFTPQQTDRGTIYSVGDELQVTHRRPILPRTSTEVTSSDGTARSAIITGLASTDRAANAVFARPTIASSILEPEIEHEVDAFPAYPLNLTTFETPSGTEQRLVVIPAQYFSLEDGTTNGVQRLYDQVDTVVYYNDDPTAEYVRPEILRSQATISGSTVSFEVAAVDRTVVGQAVPEGQVARVTVVYRDGAGWHHLDLADTDGDGIWTASASITGSRVEFLSQAIDSEGNGAASTGKARLHDAVHELADGVTPPAEPDVSLSGTRGPEGWFTSNVTVEATGPAGVTYTYSPSQTLTDEGVHLIEITGSDGSQRLLTVGIDRTAPTITGGVPDGAVFVVGEPAPNAFTCGDTGSGVASCTGPRTLDTSEPVASASYTVTAVDRAGNHSSVSRGYQVVEAAADVTIDGDILFGANPLPAGSTTSVSVTVSGPSDVTVRLLRDGLEVGTLEPAGPAANGGTTYTGSIGPLEVGVYEVTVRADGTAGSASVSALLPVYDPSAGFVTGGGWIWSEPGDYRGDLAAEGRANFGFVSRYQKGASTPTGKTEFQFQAGSFRFQSDSYDWLVVSGARAQYKGTGSVNGVSGYRFLLTASDSAIQGGGTADAFRIKIWEVAPDGSDGDVVYDNAEGPDKVSDSPLDPIGGGSIVIHKK